MDLLKQAVKRRGVNIEVWFCSEKSQKTSKKFFMRILGGGDPERHNRVSDVNSLEGAQVQDWPHPWHRHQCLLSRGCPGDFHPFLNILFHTLHYFPNVKIIFSSTKSFYLSPKIIEYYLAGWPKTFLIAHLMNLRRWQQLNWKGSIGKYPLNQTILSEKTNQLSDHIPNPSNPHLDHSTWWSTPNGALLATMGNWIMSKPNGTKR